MGTLVIKAKNLDEKMWGGWESLWWPLTIVHYAKGVQKIQNE